MKLTKEYSIEEYKKLMHEKGWIIFHEVVDPALIERLKNDLEASYKIRRPIQENNGVDTNTAGTAHHLLADGKSFFKFLSNLYLDEEIKEYFEGNYILNTFGGNLNLRGQHTYASNVHRDVRTYTSDIKLLLNILVVLDDFTPENGATYLLSGSHLKKEKPTEDYFFNHSERVVAKRGSIVFWDANLWHAAGENQTNGSRRALSLIYSRPFMKQQFDYCRHLGYENVEKMPSGVKQVLGFNSRTPTSLNEWYQPLDKRFYKNDQG
ncbi:MAG: phytanoyl-CoA dioxygenase family protein [Bacteroidetes bacterium]|nr:phytanoyl-CoA dioxygenase family protein [Bacteroidota bacterium]